LRDQRLAVVRRPRPRQHAVVARRAEHALVGDAGTGVRGVRGRADDLLDDGQDEQPDEAALRLLLLLGRRRGRLALPKQLTCEQIDDPRFDLDACFAAENHVGGAVLAHLHADRRIGTEKLAQLCDLDLLCIGRAGNAVLPEGLVDQRDRQHVVAGFGQRQGRVRPDTMRSVDLG